jgi:hypothetical protein
MFKKIFIKLDLFFENFYQFFKGSKKKNRLLYPDHSVYEGQLYHSSKRKTIPSGYGMILFFIPKEFLQNLMVQNTKGNNYPLF